jgi:hypothetical protein
MCKIIAGVDDNGQVFGWQNLRQAFGQFCAAHAARQGDNFRGFDFHGEKFFPW